MDPQRNAEEIGDDLRVLGTPERAVAERAYLKSDLHHHGTSVPNMRTVVKRFLRARPDLHHDELIGTCLALWTPPSGEPPIHEQRSAAVLLLDERTGLLTIADVPTIEMLVRSAKTWAYVDTLADHVVARMTVVDRAMLEVLDRWVVDDDFWLRRAAVLGLGGVLREGAELPRFFRYADLLLPEREFFIRKALGWVARETGQRHPDDVSAWVRRNMPGMNGVTIREAVKYLPDGDELLGQWRAR